LKYSEIIAQWLVEMGYSHCFFVAGGGIMHLLDGFREKFECVSVVNEVSAGIATEHFNETSLNGMKAFALVTTGPGLTNIVTAIAGCYVEHRELLVIAGQVKSTDLLSGKERQKGVQEVNGSSICNAITVQSCCLTTPISKEDFTSIVAKSHSPHPGPVLVEICLDVQGKSLDAQYLDATKEIHQNAEILIPELDISSALNMLKNSDRPLILLGGLVSRAIAWEITERLENLGIPLATTTSAIDRITSFSHIYAGRPGTWGGQRFANLILAQADLVIAVGAQLDLQQTGFDYTNYSPSGRLIHVFPSRVELNRKGPPSELKIVSDTNIFIDKFSSQAQWEDNIGWLEYVKKIRELVPTLETSNLSDVDYINPFVFYKNLSIASKSDEILALCSSGGTFTGALQSYSIKSKQIATTSAALASMGYGLATAIGASMANPGNTVILTEGEGGFSQNLQELAVIKNRSLPIKVFIIDNGGYGSIRSTQKRFFNGSYLGCDPETGLAFPNWFKLFEAYDIPCRILKKADIAPKRLRHLMDSNLGPAAWIVEVDPEQTNWPAIATKLSADGSMSSSPIYEMLPKLSDDIHAKVTHFLNEGSRLSKNAE
jgi:acetolactate synthase-1/2/3 large subunit